MRVLLYTLRKLNPAHTVLLSPVYRHTSSQRQEWKYLSLTFYPLLNFYKVRRKTLQVNTTIVISCTWHVFTTTTNYTVLYFGLGYCAHEALDDRSDPWVGKLLEEFSVMLVPEKLSLGYTLLSHLLTKG
jgi:hypothetical protein